MVKIFCFLRRCFFIDAKSLIVFRAAVALVLIADLALRVRDFTAHYTYNGLVGEAELDSLYSVWWERMSLFDVSPSNVWAAAIFLAGFVCAGALLAGWHARLFAFLSWLVIYSIQRRNPVIFNGGDVLLRMFLVWLVFLCPRGKAPFQPLAGGAAVFGITFQLCIVYLVGAFAKGHAMWRVEGNAVEHALRLESFQTPVAAWAAPFLLHHSQVLKMVTSATLLLEEVGPFLLLMSWHRPVLRTCVVAAFVSFHLLGIAVFLNIGVFPFVCAAGWLLFLPKTFWDRVQSLSLLRRFPGCFWEPAALAGGPDVPVPKYAQGLLSSVLPWCITGYVAVYNICMYNVSSLDAGRHPWVAAVGRATGLAQNWQLFAPYVNTRDGWYIGEATLKDGSKVDPVRQVTPIGWEKPAHLAAEYPTKRWRRYLHNMYHNRNPVLINAYARFVSQAWLEKHPQSEIASLKIYFMMQDSMFPQDGLAKVQVYPVTQLDENGRAVFPGDTRRNTELAQAHSNAAR